MLLLTTAGHSISVFSHSNSKLLTLLLNSILKHSFHQQSTTMEERAISFCFVIHTIMFHIPCSESLTLRQHTVRCVSFTSHFHFHHHILIAPHILCFATLHILHWIANAMMQCSIWILCICYMYYYYCHCQLVLQFSSHTLTQNYQHTSCINRRAGDIILYLFTMVQFLVLTLWRNASILRVFYLPSPYLFTYIFIKPWSIKQWSIFFLFYSITYIGSSHHVPK